MTPEKWLHKFPDLKKNVFLGVLHRRNQWWGKFMLEFWERRRQGVGRESSEVGQREGRKYGALTRGVMEIRTQCGF